LWGRATGEQRIEAFRSDIVMVRGKSVFRNRRGTTAVECAVVYPVVMFLTLGTVVMGLGIFRYEQLQALAREGARYASVHGPNYAAATGDAQASSSSVQTYLDGMAVGLNGLQCTSVSYSATALPCTVSVTLSYTWRPEGLFLPMTWTPTSTMAVTY
jgi:Flp pilus assembly protein TadG